MRKLSSTLSLTAAIIASAIALALPGTATANTAGGSGSAPFTISTNKFTAYSCSWYAKNQHITYYNCTGGVRSGGYFYRGTKCVRYNYGWGWYNTPCRNIV